MRVFVYVCTVNDAAYDQISANFPFQKNTDSSLKSCD